MKHILYILIILMAAGSIHAWVPICIDAGHGGSDPGAKVCTSLDSNYWEKDLNLEIAMLLRDSLLPVFEHPTTAYFTRFLDNNLELTRRAWIADSVNADAFISIHFNSDTNHAAQ